MGHYEIVCPHCRTDIRDEDDHVCRGVVSTRVEQEVRSGDSWSLCIGGEYDRLRHPCPDVEYREVRLSEDIRVWVHHSVSTLAQATTMVLAAYDRESS